MNVIVDVREKALIKLLNAYKFMFEMEHINIQLEALDIGDVIIKDTKNNEERIIFERKHISDLASSIVDGRYKEQSFRLNSACNLSNHNIIYIIEGSISSLNSKFTKVKPSAIYSAICSLQYFKGFSVMKTINTEETCEYILRMADKIFKENELHPYYLNNEEQNDIQAYNRNIFDNTNYTDVVKRTKKDNITRDNIGIIMLSQIPGISPTTARHLLKNGEKSIFNFVNDCNTDPNYLSSIEFESNGKIRKLSRTSIDSIEKYLLFREEITININN